MAPDPKPRAVRPAHVQPDPRTDGVGDLWDDVPSDEEIAAGVAHDEEHRRRTIADPATPYADDPQDDAT
jgi:hypothetical protein